MKAYAIFDGGGVKGAAFAGCLAAAEARDIEFVGYAGTSAGSVAALLAAVGYTPVELKKIFVDEIEIKHLIDGPIEELKALQKIPMVLSTGKVGSSIWAFKVWRALSNSSSSIEKLTGKLGLYAGDNLSNYLREKVLLKLPNLKNDFTFADLKNAGCKPLKVLASDLGNREPKIYGGDDSMGDIVLNAVRGSISYPFVYRPMIMNQQRFVDGGLSCNLPLSIFEEERKKQNIPVIAFDLVSAMRLPSSDCTFTQFLSDMAATALESSENLLSSIVRDVLYVKIPVPSGINALDFDLSKNNREQLYTAGENETHKALSSRAVSHWNKAHKDVTQIQALYAPEFLVKRVLSSLVQQLEGAGLVKDVRANVFLPVGSDRLKIIYQYGMDDDPDLGIDFQLNGGCVGLCFSNSKPAMADLGQAAKNDNFIAWNMTKAQQNQVRSDRMAVICVPIFDPNSKGPNADIRGVLAIDTSTNLADTGWMGGTFNGGPLAFFGEWADIVSRVIFA